MIDKIPITNGFLSFTNKDIEFAIVAKTFPSSKIYLILEAIKINKIVGKALITPFKNNFKTSLKSLLTTYPAIKPPNKKITVKITTEYCLVALILVNTIIADKTIDNSIEYCELAQKRLDGEEWK